jgi:hypothetical protein
MPNQIGGRGGCRGEVVARGDESDDGGGAGVVRTVAYGGGGAASAPRGG